MPGPFAPADNVLGPIIHTLAQAITAQIPSIAYVYEKLPNKPPTDNQVVLPLLKAKIEDDTNAKLKVRWTIGMRHLFRPTESQDAIGRAYTYIVPWLLFISAWNNLTLGGQAIATYLSDLAVTPVTMAGQPFMALAINFDILTEFNIVLT